MLRVGEASAFTAIDRVTGLNYPLRLNWGKSGLSDEHF